MLQHELTSRCFYQGFRMKLITAYCVFWLHYYLELHHQKPEPKVQIIF
jgi:hypothetical protein